MRVTPTITMTDAKLTSTTAAEPGTGETAWSNVTAYNVGDVVIRATTHRKYRCVQAHTNHDPATDTASAYWLDIGPTNAWAMFDLERNTGTTVASPLEVVITPGERVDTIGLVGLVADQIEVEVTVSGSPVYSATIDLLDRPVVSWYAYFFWPFRYKAQAALFNLPPYTNAVITVTISRATGDVTCGGVVLGRNIYLGRTLHSPEREGLNFSKVDRDEFGTATLVPRRTVPRTAQQIRCTKANVPVVLDLIESLNAVPALWSGLDDQDSGFFPALLILGFYKKLSINMDQPDAAIITLELEEV